MIKKKIRLIMCLCVLATMALSTLGFNALNPREGTSQSGEATIDVVMSAMPVKSVEPVERVETLEFEGTAMSEAFTSSADFTETLDTEPIVDTTEDADSMEAEDAAARAEGMDNGGMSEVDDIVQSIEVESVTEAVVLSEAVSGLKGLGVPTTQAVLEGTVLPYLYLFSTPKIDPFAPNGIGPFTQRMRWVRTNAGDFLCYCAELKVHTEPGTGYNSTVDSGVLDNYPLICKIVGLGFHKNLPFTSDETTISTEDKMAYIATQLAVWQAQLGWWNEEWATQNCIDTANQISGDCARMYEALRFKVDHMETIPSFSQSSKATAPTHTLKWNSKESRYEITLPDSTRMQAYFDFEATGGIQCEKQGNQYTFYTSKPIQIPVILSAKSQMVQAQDSGMKVYYNHDIQPGWGERAQSMAVLNADMVGGSTIAYVGFRTEEVRGKILLEKQDAQGNGVQGDGSLEKAVYEIYAAERIKTWDGQNTVYEAYKAGDTKSAKSFVGTLTTDAQGKAHLDNLHMGSYLVIERTPSEGYLVNDDPIKVVLKTDNTPVVEVTAVSKETVIKQPFKLLKMSTPVEGSGASVPLSGIEFTVKLKSQVQKVGWAQAKVVTRLTTDTKGEAVSEPLPYGVYQVRETKTKDNYEAMEDFFVTIDKDSLEPLIVPTIFNEPYKARVQVVKKDASSHEVVQVAGVAFKIKNKDTGAYVTHTVDGAVTEQFVTGEDGSFITEMPIVFGSYVLEEISAPGGYVLSLEAIPFEIHKDAEAAKDEDGIPVVSITMENIPVMGKIQIHKTGAVDGDRKIDLENVTFCIKAGEDIYTPDGQQDETGERQVIYKKGEPVETLVTDKTGNAESKALPLGLYIVTEEMTQPGFVRDETAHEIELSQKDSDAEVVYGSLNLTNTQTQVIIFKKDNSTEKNIPGTRLEIQNQQGETVEAWTSAEDGHTVYGLEPGETYRLIEIEPAPGYTTTKPMEFTVESKTDLQVITFYNTKIQVPSVPTETPKTPVETPKTGDSFSAWSLVFLGSSGLAGILWAYFVKKLRRM